MKRYISILGLIFFIIIISLSLFVDFNLTNNGYAVKDNLFKKVVYTESQEKQTKDVLDLRGINNSFVSIAKRVIPAVVSINTEKMIKISSRENPFEFFFFPFGRRDDEEIERRFQGLGSGMIISSDGYYGIGKVQDGEQELLEPPQMYHSDAIYTDNQPNHIRAECNGSRLALTVNGVLVAETSDSSFHEGDIGLIVGSFDDPGVDIWFDNLVVLVP